MRICVCVSISVCVLPSDGHFGKNSQFSDAGHSRTGVVKLVGAGEESRIKGQTCVFSSFASITIITELNFVGDAGWRCLLYLTICRSNLTVVSSSDSWCTLKRSSASSCPITAQQEAATGQSESRERSQTTSIRFDNSWTNEAWPDESCDH